MIRPPDSPDRYIEPVFPDRAVNLNAASVDELAALFADIETAAQVAASARAQPFQSVYELGDMLAVPDLSAALARGLVAGPPPLGAQVGEGKYRRVFSCRQGVCKIPIHLKGGRANLIEQDRWHHRARLYLEDWLCPVIACAEDGSWLVMQRAQLLDNVARRPAHPPHVRALRDTNGHNWGQLDGRLVLIDYGYPEDDDGTELPEA